MPVDINRLTDGWLELESDPGLFTLLLEDFGVKGVQVEEIYDLQKSLDSPVYGFIFLFRWIEERRSRRKIVDQSEIFVKNEDIVNNIFFAQQMVPNSCATHSLLSVLLNCSNMHLGETLSRLKVHTSGMNPENKGWAIGNTPELAKAHNSHAMPQAKRRLDKSTGISTGRYTGEAYHFVSYVPINGRLFELDGLKPFPMDHGPWREEEDWTEKFRRVITDRLGIATGEKYNDIRFNLMAVVPDKRLGITHKLNMLKTNRQIVLEALQQLVKLNHPDLAVSPKDGKTSIVGDEANNKQKVSPGAKRKESSHRSSVGANTSLSSIEDALDLASPNKILKKLSESSGKDDTVQKNIDESAVNSLLADEMKDEKYEENNGEERNQSLPSDKPVAAIDSIDTDNTGNERAMKDAQQGHERTTALNIDDTSATTDLNLSKISLIVTSEDNVVVKTEIMEPANKTPSAMDRPDYSTPLTIQTSPAPSTSSTDTSSEVGSAFNSPTQGWGWNSGQSSPNSSAKDFKKFVVIRVAMAGTGGGDDKFDSPTGRSKRDFRKVCLEAGALPKGWEKPPGSKLSGLRVSPLAVHENSPKTKSTDGSPMKLSADKSSSNETQQHTFAPKDLLALLKNLEGEISLCEGNLRDENEKRKKYKVDDCRRTHNYDEFICTFLSMLAQQGKLADLVQQHLFFQRKPSLQQQKHVAQPKTNSQTKRQETKVTSSSNKRGKKNSKYRKRK